MANENKNTRSYNSSKKGPELGKVPEKLIKEQLKLPPQAVVLIPLLKQLLTVTELICMSQLIQTR